MSPIEDQIALKPGHFQPASLPKTGANDKKYHLIIAFSLRDKSQPAQ
jgi:hypothetical protein